MIAAIMRLAFCVVIGQLIALLVGNGDIVSQRGAFLGSVLGWAIVEAAFVVIRRRRK